MKAKKDVILKLELKNQINLILLRLVLRRFKKKLYLWIHIKRTIGSF